MLTLTIDDETSLPDKDLLDKMKLNSQPVLKAGQFFFGKLVDKATKATQVSTFFNRVCGRYA